MTAGTLAATSAASIAFPPSANTRSAAAVA
jgi:hypothetical protein